MKFEYHETDDRGQCVAYVDKHNHLIVKNYRSYYDNDRSFVFMTTESKDSTTMWDKFDPDDAVHKFYKGDKITITF